MCVTVNSLFQTPIQANLYLYLLFFMHNNKTALFFVLNFFLYLLNRLCLVSNETNFFYCLVKCTKMTTSPFPRTLEFISEFILWIYLWEHFPSIDKSQYLPNSSNFRVILAAFADCWIAVQFYELAILIVFEVCQFTLPPANLGVLLH